PEGGPPSQQPGRWGSALARRGVSGDRPLAGRERSAADAGRLACDEHPRDGRLLTHVHGHDQGTVRVEGGGAAEGERELELWCEAPTDRDRVDLPAPPRARELTPAAVQTRHRHRLHGPFTVSGDDGR